MAEIGSPDKGVAAERPAIGSPENGGAVGSAAVGGSGRVAEYAGWVYHLGVNSIGHQYCHLRYLFLRGIKVLMYKRDPQENPGIKPIRKGVVSHTLVVEELGRRKVNNGDLYVLKFYNKLDESKKGEIACAAPGELRKWFEAFEQAKQQAEFALIIGSGRHRRLSIEDELNLEGHRRRVRKYAQHGLGKLIKIGQGPEMLLRQASDIGSNNKAMDKTGDETGDAVEAHDWRCVRTVNGIRIFEDAANSKGGKGILLKSVGVVNANIDAVFEVIFSLEPQKRYEWDVLTSDLELVESIDGHIDIIYAKYDPKYLTWWNSKKDFVFSRQWFHGQDGTYTILQFPHEHKKKPKKSRYERIKINPSIWEIRRLNSNFGDSKCLVTQMVEVQTSFWEKWKKNGSSNFEKSIPFSLLCQVAGLREYFEANPSLTLDPASEPVWPRYPAPSSVSSSVNSEIDENSHEANEEFYDAIGFGGNILEDEDSDDDFDDNNDFQDAGVNKDGRVKLKNVSWAIAGLALKRSKATLERNELNSSSLPVIIDPSQFKGSLKQAKNDQDSNCWSSPSGNNFMIRGKTYLTDHSKIAGGDPLLKLIGVDWLKSEDRMDNVALKPKSLVQSEAGTKVPFILVVNLQIPAKPNYSLVAYYGSERPINNDSLLGRFVDGSDLFRDSRFKLIPSIVEGYWMVKRAVGTKACLLGKAVTCNYLRQDNFLEIDVDIGSSSVARSIIGLVLGYVTGIVVDLAILIEGKEERELPEYILGTVRLNRLKPESAVSL